jgi:hypothetical protein
LIRKNISERIGQFEVHPLARCGVYEGDGLCLEIQTVSLPAIEFIAEDWTAETLGMGAVHAKLMGPSSVWPKGKEGHRGTAIPLF